MGTRRHRDDLSIWPRPVIWLWLLANIAWLQFIVPVWIVANDLVVMDPDATVTGRVIAAGMLIVVIPLLGIVGMALATLVALLGTERVVQRWRRPVA